MTPFFHALVGGALGAGVYEVSGSWEAGVATFSAGLLPDADHLLDLYNWCVRRRTHRLFYLFHGWEYLGLSLLITVLPSGPALLVGVTMGYASHIVGDYLANHRVAFFYSLVYRAWHGFHRRQTLPSHLNTRLEGPYALIVVRDRPLSKAVVLRWLLTRCLQFHRKARPQKRSKIKAPRHKEIIIG